MRPIDADALIETLNDYGVPYYADIDYFIECAPTIDQPSSEWIPCSERLPKAQFEGQRRGWYLTTNANGCVGETGYEFYHDFMKTGWQSDFRILAWMPLPEPWKEGESNG